jgi:TPR repeat protein
MKAIVLICSMLLTALTGWGQKIKELSPKTPPSQLTGSVVKTSGSTPKPRVIEKNKDSDGDGIIDAQDPCPFKRGPLSNEGCPTAAAPKESGSELYKKGLEAFNNNLYSEAVEFLVRATELKNGSAACLLGKIYYDGEAMPIDLGLAFAYFDTAAMYGNDIAMYNLGVMYKNGYGISTDYNKAMENFYKAADKNNDESMVTLGDIFIGGELVPKNVEKGINWYEKAAALGNMDASFNLGTIYMEGQHVTRNTDKAIEWFRKAAESGNETAMRHLAVSYEQKKYLGDAYLWYKKAADKGDLLSMVKLVSAYRNGAGNIAKDADQYSEWLTKTTEMADSKSDAADGETLYQLAKMFAEAPSPDKRKIFDYYKKAADAGHKQAFSATAAMAMEGWGDGHNDAIYYYTKAAESTSDAGAMYQLGLIYLGEIVPSKKDLKIAAQWFTQASDKGHGLATTSLGKQYLQGLGVEVNYSKAFNLFAKAADQNIPEAQHSLGLCYYWGQGTNKDYAKAFESLQKSAAADYVYALADVGDCYRLGEGTEKNFQKAFEYYQKAAQQGNTSSMLRIGLMYENGEGFSKNIPKALEWYQKAADLDNASGMYKMGFLYWEGKEVGKDINRANLLFTKAASKGHNRAKHYVALRLLKEKNYNEAFKYFREASLANVKESAFYLASFYEEGIATSQNYTEAIKWYEIAAEINNSDAMNNLGLMYQSAKGMSQADFSTAAKWFTRSAELGNPSAMNNLGSLYNTGKGVQQSKKTAMDWFKKACDAGSQTGCDNVKKFR